MWGQTGFVVVASAQEWSSRFGFRNIEELDMLQKVPERKKCLSENRAEIQDSCCGLKFWCRWPWRGIHTGDELEFVPNWIAIHFNDNLFAQLVTIANSSGVDGSWNAEFYVQAWYWNRFWCLFRPELSWLRVGDAKFFDIWNWTCNSQVSTIQSVIVEAWSEKEVFF